MMRRLMPMTCLVFAICVFPSIAQEKAKGNGEGIATLEKAFKAQLQVNMQVQVIESPKSNDWVSWSSFPYWSSTRRAQSVLVVLEITPAIIESGVAYWAATHDADDEEKGTASAKLTRQFLRDKQRCFVVIVDPIRTKGWEDEWRVSVGPIEKNLTLLALDGKVGKVTTCEKRLDRQLKSADGKVSCLVFVEDSVDPELQPCFTLRLSNILYSIRNNRAGDQGEPSWVDARETELAEFRFETGDVKMIAMLEKGVPWETIEKQYVLPKQRVIEAGSGSQVATVVTNLACDIVTALLFKLL